MDTGVDTVRTGLRVVIFGASGMIGQGVLRECLEDSGVVSVLVVGRTATGQQHKKLREIEHKNFADFTPIQADLGAQDACFWCLGVSAAGMNEGDYTKVTFDYTLAAARVMAKMRPDMAFFYVSGQGTDSSEKGRRMWARIKGRTENALLALPFKAVMFRPGLIQPMHGVKSKTGLYRAAYALTGPLLPLLEKLAPASITTSERMGRAMLRAAKDGSPKRILETPDINTLGRG